MLTWAARHLYFLKGIPGLPQMFDLFLQAHSRLLRPERFHYLQTLEKTLLCWPGMTTKLHKFGGVEFIFRSAQGSHEVGHLHGSGLLDIPFTKNLHDEVIAEGMAQPHHIFPNSGWISFQIETHDNLQSGLNLLWRNYERWQKQDML